MEEYGYMHVKKHHVIAFVIGGVLLGFVTNLVYVRHVHTPTTKPMTTLRPTSTTNSDSFGLYFDEHQQLLLSDADIVAYVPTEHSFIVTTDAIRRLNAMNGSLSVRSGLGFLFQKKFSVRLGSQTLYRGEFWSWASSLAQEGVKIYFPIFSTNTLNISFWQFQSSTEASDAPAYVRAQPKLIEYFRRHQKIATSTPAPTPLPPEVRAKEVLPPRELSAHVTPYQNFYHDAEFLKAADPSVVSLQFFGDIMLDRNVAKVMGASGTAYIFEHIVGEGNGLDSRIDLTIANNEGPYAPTRVKTSKSIAFRFDPKYATELKHAGFDAVSLANNHTLDMGWKNVDFTHQTLEAAGVGHFGDQLRESKDFTFVTTTNGQTIALVGFNNTDHIMDLKKISAVIADAKARASTTIVMMHWGDEYKRLSNVNQRTFAHYLIDEGVDAVIGAHPHVIQEAEIYKGKPIFYSLGNFVFDQYFSNDTQEGLSVGLILKQGKVHSVYAFPLYSVKSQVFLMDGQRRDNFYGWLNATSRLGDKKFEGGKIDLVY